MVIAALVIVATLAIYVVGWRHGYAAGGQPRRRRTD